MKLLASIVAVATLSCAAAVLMLPAFAQPAPAQPSAQHQPQHPLVVQPPAEEAPPRVRVTQPPASGSGFSGVIESIGTKYTMFLNDGDRRATTDLGDLDNQKGRTPPPDTSNVTPQTPTSPHTPRRPLTPRATGDKD